MDTEPPQTPDIDLPGQQHPQADLDIEIQPEPDTQGDQASARSADELEEDDASPDDPELGNTLIRPENS